MKRYILSIFAVVVAISMVAFTSPAKSKKPQVNYYVFEFNPNLSYTVANVENEANWTYKGLNQVMCDNTNEKACRVKVISSYVNDPSGSPTLKTDANISATLSGTTAHVTGIAGTSSGNAYSNQPD